MGEVAAAGGMKGPMASRTQSPLGAHPALWALSHQEGPGLEQPHPTQPDSRNACGHRTPACLETLGQCPALMQRPAQASHQTIDQCN